MSTPSFVTFPAKRKIVARFAENRSDYSTWHAVGQFENESFLVISAAGGEVLVAQAFAITNSNRYEIFSYIVTSTKILTALLENFPNNIPLGFSTFQRMHIEAILKFV